MKKFFGFLFWISVIGGAFYFYKKNPHINEYFKLISERIQELFEHHHCCSPPKIDKEEEKSI